MSTSIFTGISSGLTSTYSLLAQAYGATGVTHANIVSAMSNSALATTLNPTFASYMQTNFSTLDTDKDGKLSATELSNITNQMMSQGLTQAQLAQLGTASGMSNQMLSQVLEHFNDIDSNHDGKVTAAEVKAFTIRSVEEKKKAEFANKAATNMSVFYGDEDSSNASSSSSILSYKYMNTDNNGAQSI